MNEATLRRLLRQVREGAVEVEDAARQLQTLPVEDLGFARIDHHRWLRRGFPEVIYSPGKSPDQIAALAERLAAAGQTALATRADSTAFEAVRARLPDAVYHSVARCIVVERGERPQITGVAMVTTGGTSDIPIAEEAALTAELAGARVDRLWDVGVAGLHRVLGEQDRLRAATVHVVVAGMEGALPSVIGGLVDRPVIAVPTSVGYGAAFGGLAALLGMLNSCAPGVSVVNIDNGFGAGLLAAMICRLAGKGS